MDIVLVFSLILAFLCCGQSLSRQTVQTSDDQCYILCPAGYYKIGSCNDTVKRYKCKQCENNTYTEVENFTEKCKRCKVCNHDEVVKKPCSFNSNTVCEYKNVDPQFCCKKCNCNCPVPHGNPNSNKMCQDCQRPACLQGQVSIVPAPTMATSTSTKYVIPIQNTSAKPITKMFDGMSWMILLVIGLLFLMLFGLAWLFMWIPPEKPNGCPCWGMDREDHSHQDSNQSTVTLRISEESPMMPPSDSPDTPQHPAHINPLPPNAIHTVAKQDEQSEHWPPIVLYAIIKEVPLRRWKEFLRLLSLADQELERVELETGLGLGSIERQYQMLRLWSQRSTASLNDVFSALHYMDLSGCAQLLQESLEKLQLRPEQKQGVTASRDFSVAMQDTRGSNWRHK